VDLSARQPAINHACKGSHLKSFTNQRPSCNTEFLLLGKYCVDLWADLMMQINRYRKYAEGYLCLVNPFQPERWVGNALSELFLLRKAKP